MAITFNGLITRLQKDQIPVGYTEAIVDKVLQGGDDFQSINFTLQIAKSTVENADDVVTFTALHAAFEQGILDYLTAYYDNTKTVESYASLVRLETNTDSINKKDYFKNVVTSYKGSIQIIVSVGA